MEQEQEQPQQQDPFQPFIDLYRRNPLQFSDRSAKYIQKYAAEHNIDLTPPVSPYELDPFKLANQAFSGFVSGFTALGDYADDTQNIWENLTNSLGHLFGFVGSLFALGGIGKGIVMGATTTARVLRGAAAASRVEKALTAAGVVKFRSVPMQVADIVGAKFSRSAAGKLTARYLEGRPLVKQIVESGGHLAVASAVGQLHEGFDAALESGASGFVAGSTFGMIGNIPILQGNTTAYQFLRGLAGGLSQVAMTGMHTTVQGENWRDMPIPILAYDFLLGGFFGWKSTDYRHYKIAHDIRKVDNFNALAIEGSEIYKSWDPETRAIWHNELREKMFQKKAAGNFFRQLFVGTLGYTPIVEKVEVGDKIIKDTGDPNKVYTVSRVGEEGVQTKEGELIPSELVIKHVPKNYEVGRVVEERSTKDLVDDMGDLMQTVENKFVRWVIRSGRDTDGKPGFPKDLDLVELLAKEKSLMENLRTLLKDDTIEDKWTAFKGLAERYIQGRVRPIDKTGKVLYPMEEKDFNDIEEWFSREVNSVKVNRITYDRTDRKVVFEDVDSMEGTSVDPDGISRPLNIPRSELNNVPTALDPDGNPIRMLNYVVMDQIAQKYNKRTGKYTIDLVKGNLSPQELGIILSDLHKKGMGLIGGVGEKGQLIFGDVASDEILNRIRQELTDANLWKRGMEIIESSAKNLDINPGIVEKNYLNIAYVLKQLMGVKTFTEWQTAEAGRYLMNALDYNKRMPVLISKYYPIIPERLPKDFNSMAVYVVDENKRTDGAMFMRDYEHTAFADAIGLSGKKIAALKPFYSSRGQLHKMALFAKEGNEATAMSKAGIGAIVTTTSAKTYGDVEVYKMKYNSETKEYEFYNRYTGERVLDPTKYKLDMSAFRVSRDIYDSAVEKMNRRTTLTFSMSAFFDNPEVAKIYNTYVNSFANGTTEGNKVFADYIKSGNLELVKEALRKDPEWFRTVNKTDLLNELRKDERLAEIFNKWLVMESFHSEYDFEDRLLSEDYEVTGSPGRRAVELSGGRAGVVLSKAFGKDLEHLYNKFFVRERVRPKVPYAGSARLAPLPDDMLHLEDINKFYLGRDLASMKIVGMNEKLQQEEMTLAKQWNLYKRLAQKTELTDLEKEKLNAYKEVLSTVVTRVPIPDASGILNLEFGGFLPKKGGGLYIARSVMNELAGADYDIDSAFFYFGIPKEYREWVKGKRGAIPEYDKVMGRHGAEEIHFSKDRRGETYAHEFAGMFDPYTLVQSNLISSAGRSENLARSIVFVRRLNSLLLQLKVAGIKLDTGNLLLVPVDEGDRIRAEATKFGVIGASADAAKGGKTEKGTVLDFISMRRNIILSNFKEIRTKGGEIIFNESDRQKAWKYDKTSETWYWDKLEPKKEYLLQYIVGRPKEYFGDVWKDVVKTFPGGAGRIDKIPYMQTMMDVHSKMLRKAIGRPWNFNEVSRASKNALKVFDTVDSQAEIFAHFARSLKDVNMDFGYFTHMFPKKDSDSFFRTWNAILKTYPQLTSFLPYRLPVQYEDLNNRAKALASYWEKLENQDLRYFFVQNMEDFNALVWDIVKTRNIPERKEKYGSLGAEKGLSKFYKDYEVNKPSLTHSLNNEVRVRWIEENIRQVNSYLSERFSLVASVKSLSDLHYEMGIAPERLRELLTKKYEMAPGVEVSLLDFITGIKQEWNITQRVKFGDIEPTDSTPTPEKVIRHVLYGRTLVDKLAKEYGIDPDLLHQFYDTLLLSPIKEVRKIGEIEQDYFTTSESMIGLKVARPNAVKRYVLNLADAYDITIDSEQKEAIKKYFNLGIQKAIYDTEQIAPSVHRKTYLPKEEIGIKVSKEVQQLAKEIEHYLANPKHPLYKRPEELMQILRHYFGIAQPTDMDVYHMRGLANILREWQYGPTLINRLLGLSPEERAKIYVDKVIKFPDTVDQEALMFDFNQLTERLEVPYGKRVDYFNPYSGKVEKVFAQASKPISTLGKIQAIFTYGNQTTEAEVRRIKEEHDRIFAPQDKAHNQRTQKKGASELFEYAVLRKELEEWNPGETYTTDRKEDFARLFRLKSEWEQKNKQLLSDSYTYTEVNEKGENVRVTTSGNELVDYFLKQIHYSLDNNIFMSQEWIRNNLVFDKYGVVDVSKVKEKFHNFLAVNPEKLDIPSQFTGFLAYLVQLEKIAKSAGPDNFLVGENVHKLPKVMHDIQMFDTPFLARIKGEASRLGLVGKYSSELREWAVREYRQWENSGRVGKLNPTASELLHYFDPSRDINEKFDWRAPFYGANARMSMFISDVEYINGKIPRETYIMKFLMNTYRYQQMEPLTGYFPRRLFDPIEVQKWVKEQHKILQELAVKLNWDPETLEKKGAELTNVEKGIRGMDVPETEEVGEAIADGLTSGKDLINLESVVNRRPSSTQARSAYVPGYDTTPDAILDYRLELTRSKYKSIAAALAYGEIVNYSNRTVESVERDAWIRFLNIYSRQALGLPSIFNDSELNDPILKLKQTPFWYLSDHAFLSSGTRINKTFRKLMLADYVTDSEKLIHNLDTPQKVNAYKEKKARELTTLTGNPEKDRHNLLVGSRLLKNFSTFEGKYELAQMLFSLKTGIANLGGGGVSNYIYNGWDATWNAWNVKLWNKIDSRFKSRADIWKWVYDLGILNSMVYNEVGIRDIVSKKPEARAALEEVFDMLKKNPDTEDVRIAEIFKKHNVGQRFTEIAGWIMKSTERINRTWSFLSGYLSARKSYEYLDLPLNTPQLIEAGKKSVDTTQFLYDNTNRGLFTSTNLGHIYGRFKLWAWRSVHYQRTLLNEAANQGFRPGSIEAERLERLVTANMFAVGLAALLPYTIFDAVLPGGLQTLQNLADWMFGSESERERAFYSQNNLILKGWLAPLNELTPPVSRVPGALEVGFEWLFDPEFEKKQQYVLWTTFMPFGRMSYDLYRSFQNPAMATDFMLGIPLHRFQTLKNKSWGTGSRGI